VDAFFSYDLYSIGTLSSGTGRAFPVLQTATFETFPKESKFLWISSNPNKGP
jgi:hypothetical protein